ncbi:MAG: rhomboid family intramembrane serine protease [Acidobacteria bacterium]|nr:rhomboid family intramembrane serine protease [Acidobacteriota bacterium]
MPLPIRWRYKLDRWRESIAAAFRRKPQAARPRLCPACGTLVGATSGKCHQCGASLSFSLAAASRSLSSLLPTESPVTYVILGLNSLLFIVSLLATIRSSEGFNLLGDISGQVLYRLGARQAYRIVVQYELWRLVMPIFLHGSILHIAMNTWVLMDVGPQVEEVYGSARYLFLYVATGIFSFVASTAWTVLVYGGGGILMRGIDNAAHLGGLAAGFLLGKVMADREPADAAERKRAYLLGWSAGLVVAVSFAFMLMHYFRPA